MKANCLIVYDYGTGGVWGIMRARSPEEITLIYDDIEVVTTRPSWMGEKEYQNIAATSSFDIDNEPSSWLVGLARRR